MTKYTAYAYRSLGEDYVYIGQDATADGAKRLCEQEAGAPLNWQPDGENWVAYRQNVDEPDYKVNAVEEDHKATF